jgi:hypothetical protein
MALMAVMTSILDQSALYAPFSLLSLPFRSSTMTTPGAVNVPVLKAYLNHLNHSIPQINTISLPNHHPGLQAKR